MPSMYSAIRRAVTRMNKDNPVSSPIWVVVVMKRKIRNNERAIALRDTSNVAKAFSRKASDRFVGVLVFGLAS